MLIQCDFDGTIIRNNLSVLLREEFARGDWQTIESRYLQGQLSVEQSNQLQYALIRETRDRLQEFVSHHIEVRPGFAEFIHYCQQKAIQFVIVSSGLDFYIETVLAQIGLSHLEVYCGRTVFTEDGITVSYTDPQGKAIDRGFKTVYLDWLRKRAPSLIYIGDGLSDLAPARRADHVFATGHLARLLRAEAVAYHSFADFHDLLCHVKYLA